MFRIFTPYFSTTFPPMTNRPTAQLLVLTLLSSSFCFLYFTVYSVRRERTVVLEAADDEDEAPSCTFDDDADASIERCWASEDDNYMAPQKINLTNATDGTSNHPLALASIGAVIVVAVMVAGGLLMREIKSKKKQERDGAAFAIARGAPVGAENTKHAKEQPHGHQKTGSALDPRVNALKLSLEKEAKEKEGLSEQNNFLKSALEERKATVQMFTSELQVCIGHLTTVYCILNSCALIYL